MSGYTLNTNMAGSLQAVAVSPGKTQIIVANGTATPVRRVRTFEIEVSAISVPNATDCQIQCDYTWCTGATTGTSTTQAPQALDSGTAIGTALDTAVVGGRLNFSAEPTVFNVANSWWFRAFNQRSGALWQSIPGKEIITPSATGTTATAGPALRASSTNYAGNVASKVEFDEL